MLLSHAHAHQSSVSIMSNEVDLPLRNRLTTNDNSATTEPVLINPILHQILYTMKKTCYFNRTSHLHSDFTQNLTSSKIWLTDHSACTNNSNNVHFKSSNNEYMCLMKGVCEGQIYEWGEGTSSAYQTRGSREGEAVTNETRTTM